MKMKEQKFIVLIGLFGIPILSPTNWVTLGIGWRELGYNYWAIYIYIYINMLVRGYGSRETLLQGNLSEIDTIKVFSDVR